MENGWVSVLDLDLDQKANYGPWRYDKDTLTLRHSEGYEIDLTECNTSAEILDWLFQVSTKSWATHETVATLIEALDDLLDVQGNVCPWGVDKPFNSTQWLRCNGI